jgi:hypothetical protein
MTQSTLLYRIQRLQFEAKQDAEALLLAFVNETFPSLNVVEVTLRPQAISLNSFNGFLTLNDGTQLFFKTHVEQDNVISEYYNAEMLAAAGYPVIQPLYSSKQSNQQLLIYPIVHAPSVFDVARSAETIGEFGSEDVQRLTSLQNQSDEDLLRCYQLSFQPRASSDPNSPIHQLFWHRLTGGRFARFYNDYANFHLPHGNFVSSSVFRAHWIINGSDYANSLDELVERAIAVLDPSAHQEATIIGHGDAHNGNVFLTEQGLTYFDPAFAGRHSPLIDLVKPLFHNVFAMWMYFPDQENARLDISITERDGKWEVKHNYTLNPLRKMFFESKFERVFVPMLKFLKVQSSLRPDWREQVKLALMCCPLLTMNLAAFPPEISLLGLCFAVEMGAESSAIRSFIDQALDRAEAALA